MSGFCAVDNIDGDITSSIITSGLPLDTSEPGIRVVRYDVSDSAGNEAAQKKRFVKVVENPSNCASPDLEPPVITVLGKIAKKFNQVLY